MKKTKENTRFFQRFGIQFRLQHMVMAASCTVLILTGCPMWFLGRHEMVWWDANSFDWIGGLATITCIHRLSAFALIAVAIYHFFYTFLCKEGRREFLNFLPKIKDVTDVLQNSFYFLGLAKTKPRFDRYSYIEKFDYWAVYWGCVIMIGSGLALMFPQQTVELLPWFTYDLAAEIHAGEALLAALSIVVWHFYNVHYNPSKFPGSMLWVHGKISLEEMEEEHPVELEKILAKEKVE